MTRRTRMVGGRIAHDPQAMIGLGVLAVLFLLAFAGPYLSRWGTEPDFTAFRESPSGEHWFGTTQTGMDVYTLTLRGMRKSLVIGLLVALVSTGLAALFGTVAGYFGGWADRLLMWWADLLLVLPAFLILAIVSPALRGRTWLLLAVLLAVFLWMITARVVRAATISLREREFVLAAEFMGVPSSVIIVRHILPNLASLLVIDATLNVSAAILAESGLSYFGFGVQPPDSSLGTVIADGSASATTYPWLFLPPAVLIVLIVLSVNLLGDAMRDAVEGGV